MEILGIIPARSGSKRVPGKNIKKFCGKPLIVWTILAVRKAKLINRLIVSTDDEKIARTAKKYGVEVPFLRPRKLAGDKIGMEAVLIHALEWLKKYENYRPDGIAVLYPTTPLKMPKHLDAAINLFKNKKADSVISVHEAKGNNNPYWILKKTKNDKIIFFNGSPLKKIITQSQDLPICYSRNDIIYILKPSNLYQKPSSLYGDKVELYVMDNFFDADINTPTDWLITEIKFKKLKKGAF